MMIYDITYRNIHYIHDNFWQFLVSATFKKSNFGILGIKNILPHSLWSALCGIIVQLPNYVKLSLTNVSKKLIKHLYMKIITEYRFDRFEFLALRRSYLSI